MYDYICPVCSHEFDYEDGVKYGFELYKFIECPHCNAILDEDEKTHNNSK